MHLCDNKSSIAYTVNIYKNMMKESPQTTHNKSETGNVSAYEIMNRKIEKFINMVDEEERNNNVVLHKKRSAGTENILNHHDKLLK